jgi:uncharacterized repeat protein (TIGR03803 family)
MKLKTPLFRGGLLAIIVAVLSVGAAFAAGSTEFVIYHFPNGTFPITAGCEPQGNLVADNAGNLYGTASCGESSWGTVFEMVRPIPPSTAWTETVLYSFSGGNDGGLPGTGVIFDAAGNLYGTTLQGGASGVGTVFELSPPATPGGAWTESVLYAFLGGTTDGAKPFTGLAWDSSGNLYGTTYQGGLNDGGYCRVGCGTVFQLAHPGTPGGRWSESVIHFFFGGRGSAPRSAPIFDARGDLYGATSSGGLYSGGLVYRLTPPTTSSGTWAYKVLHAFSGDRLSTPDGAQAIGALTLRGKGVLYGTTYGGGAGQFGTVYQLVPPAVAGNAWTENILYSFSGRQVSPEDGANPEANVIFDSAGNIYGTTNAGGDETNCSLGCGTAFELSPPSSAGGTWTETILHKFINVDDGSDPSSGLVFGKNGVLFGVTLSGGRGGGVGTVFGVVK